MKRATIYEVAKRAGVSPSTVSRVINRTGPVGHETRERVERAIRELAFEPNSVARSLRTAETRTIAFLLPDISNPFFPDLVKGAQHAAMARGYSLMIANTDGETVQELAHLRAIRRTQVDGLIVAGLLSAPRELRRIVGQHMPVVMVDRVGYISGAPSIHVDHYKGAVEATRHLLALGHRRIAHIAEAQHHPLASERIIGYCDAMQEAGYADLIRVVHGDGTPDGGAAATEQLMAADPSPTAIFAADDLLAIGALSALRRRGVAVPGDVSVMGFDGIDIGAHIEPSLTTIRQPTYEMGRRAAGLIVDALLAKAPPPRQDVILDLEVVVRESTAPPKTA